MVGHLNIFTFSTNKGEGGSLAKAVKLLLSLMLSYNLEIPIPQFLSSGGASIITLVCPSVDKKSQIEQV